MSRLLLLFGLLALACGRTSRDVGSYRPTLDQGAGGEAGARNTPAEPAPDLSKPWPSSGCGQPPPNGNGSGEVIQAGDTLTGNNPALANVREYGVRTPPDYDPNRPYRIVYLYRDGCGSGMFSDEVYDLANESLDGDAQAIYVNVGMPRLDMNPHCYDTAGGTEAAEYEAFDLIHSQVESRYCVDNNRIFVAGYRQGGAVANMFGCYFGGTPDPPRKFSPRWAVRGRAVVGGWREANQPLPCNGPGAALWIQESGDLGSGDYDGSNPSALTLALTANSCAGNYDEGPKEPWPLAARVGGFQPGDCQLYTGCSAQTQADYPLVFCRVDSPGGTSRADLAIPAFTAFFRALDPIP
jgi:hypothetical protein